jgi:hypothetical protein
MTEEEWYLPLPRHETKDPWTVKDGVAHLTHWKADMARRVRKIRKPNEEQRLEINNLNHVIFMRWKDASPKEVLEWHRRVHEDVLKALREAPDEYFSGKDRGEQWPYDLDGHVRDHRVRDIERVLHQKTGASDQ